MQILPPCCYWWLCREASESVRSTHYSSLCMPLRKTWKLKAEYNKLISPLPALLTTVNLTEKSSPRWRIHAGELFPLSWKCIVHLYSFHKGPTLTQQQQASKNGQSGDTEGHIPELGDVQLRQPPVPLHNLHFISLWHCCPLGCLQGKPLLLLSGAPATGELRPPQPGPWTSGVVT